MEAVLISIQPKWCELIASGEKTVEVRKTKPKIDVPFKCYIYETQGRTETPWTDEDGHEIFKGRGQVIGEFVCDRIDEFIAILNPMASDYELWQEACLKKEEVYKYMGNNLTGYGWHISDLVIYNKPKELIEFRRPCDGNCYDCRHAIWKTPRDFSSDSKIVGCRQQVTAPQSWCYVEKLI